MPEFPGSISGIVVLIIHFPCSSQSRRRFVQMSLELQALSTFEGALLGKQRIMQIIVLEQTFPMSPVRHMYL